MKTDDREGAETAEAEPHIAPPSVPAEDASKASKAKLQTIGGTRHDEWNLTVARQLTEALWFGSADEETRDRRIDGAVLGLASIAPKDAIEAMIATQMIAVHAAAMECYRRAMLAEQTFEGRSEALSQANRLSRTSATLMEALNRHRGKGQQKVTVEHVHVHAGGQAIVGHVEGRQEKRSAPQQRPGELGKATEPPMPSLTEERGVVPIAPRLAKRGEE